MWMIYGATGYTGTLIARAAAADRPILAGRNREKVETLARELGCEWRVFDVERPQLDGVSLVLHCAGPFVHTSAPMVRACLDAGAHYVDITGEIAVFEAILRLDAEARRRGVTLLPGAGFDVVPTDCLAAMLAQRMPDADNLMIAFSGGGGISAGTRKTAVESLGRGGAIRRDGRIVRVPLLYDVREIPFPGRTRTAITIPWGDVSTAYHTTGIPNVRVYRAMSPRAVKRLRRISFLMPLLAFSPLKRLLLHLASKQNGPTAAARERSRMEIWGRVSNARGDELTLAMTTPDAYALTALTAVAAARRLLDEPVQPGAFTPAKRFGAEFIRTIPGIEIEV